MLRSTLNRFRAVARLFRERPRRASALEGRAFIELRDIGLSQLSRFDALLKQRFEATTAVQWYEVNPYTRRVIVAFDQEQIRLEELVSVVEQAEASLGHAWGARLDTESDLPDDDNLEAQRLLELGAEMLGLWAGLGFRLMPFVPTNLGVNTAAVLSFIQNTPRLRQRLDERYGRDRTDLWLNLAIAAGKAVAERPLGSLVGIAQKTEMFREVRARGRLWRAQGADLCGKPAGLSLEQLKSEPRPRRLPKGPIENHTDRVWMLALSSFGISLAATRSVKSAVAAAIGSLPTPARLGRELFTNEFGRVLAERGALVLAPEALKRLDRVDCLVLQGDLVSPAGFSLGQTVTRSSLYTAEAEKQCRTLFDPRYPLERQSRDGWSLGPPALLGVADHALVDELNKQFTNRGELVLALAKGAEVVALQEIKIVAHNEMEEVVNSAREAGIRVVVSREDGSLSERFDPYDTIAGGPELGEGIRRLQRQGHMVCFAGTYGSPGLQAADVSIGILQTDQPAPWSAQIFCSDLSQLRTLMLACAAARAVSRQSVRMALGAAAVSTLVSGGGIARSPTRRVMLAVDIATLLAMLNAARRAAALSRQLPASLLDPTPWHALEARTVLERVGSSERGLGSSDALARRMPEPPARSALSELSRAVLLELSNPLTPLMAAGAGLSALVGSTADAAMVASTGALSALIGAMQRLRAERQIRRLAEQFHPTVRLRRDGVLSELDAATAQLVQGDVIVLEPGDLVPADCRILEASGLEVDVSSLTGESLPVVKSAAPCYQEHIADRESMLYAGASITAGRASAVVVATGRQTQAERAALRKDPERAGSGGVEARLRSLMQLTGPVAAAAGVGLIGTGLLRGRKLEELVDTGVSLAVAAVPEGLPLLATAAQISAAQRLAGRGAVVSNVRSLEALGRVDIICLDKTGTLTEGRVKLQSIFDGVAEQPVTALGAAGKRVLQAALRAAAPGPRTGRDWDPTDKALGRGATVAGVSMAGDEAGSRISELPFDAARGYHVTLTQTGAEKIISIKGAPELVLNRCANWQPQGEINPLGAGERRRLAGDAEQLARAGLRVIAVAERRLTAAEIAPPLEQVGELNFLGLLLFRDLVRPDARLAVERLRKAGIRIAMLTGDHPATAQAIAEEVGLWGPGATINGAELAAMSDEELALRLPAVSVFARVTPSQKVRLVRAMQRAGHVVAMAGDGANDAPPILAADVGLAMGERSTAVTRAAADIVLADDPLQSLIDAVVEGRAMWVSVRDAVSILVGGNLGEIGFSVGAGLLSGRPPLSTRQLLLVNFFTDIAPATAIAIRPPSDLNLDALAREQAGPFWESLLNRDIAERALATTFGAATGWAVGKLTGSRERAGTIGLAALVYTQLGQTLTSGGLSAPVLLTGLGSAAALAAVIQTPGLSHLFGCRPLGPVGWAAAIGASAAATGAAMLLPQAAARASVELRELAANFLVQG